MVSQLVHATGQESAAIGGAVLKVNINGGGEATRTSRSHFLLKRTDVENTPYNECDLTVT